MTAYSTPRLTAQQIEELLPLWSKHFVAWSESPFGFYVDRYYDDQAGGVGRWINRIHPVRWAERQRRVLDYVFTIDKDGRLPLTQLWWIDIGQSGKTLIQAALAQWCGLFVDTNSEVQLAANSQNQAGVRTYKSLTNSIEFNPHMARFCEVQRENIFFLKTGNVGRALPAKAKSVSGGWPILRGIDEIWGYDTPSARDLLDELKETPTRNISLLFVSSYPPFEESDSPLNAVLDRYFDAHEQPRAMLQKVPGLEDLPFWTDGPVGIWWNHAPYPWHTKKFMDAQRHAPTATPSSYARIWEARRTPREDAFIPMEAWDRLEDPDHHPLGMDDRGFPLIVAADVGIMHDGTAVIARTVNPDTGRLDLCKHRIWLPSDFMAGRERDVLALLEQWVLDLHRFQRVLAFYFDPRDGEYVALNLERAGVNVIRFTQNNMRVIADTTYYSLIKNGMLRNYPQSSDLRDAVRHAIGVETSMQHIMIKKSKSTQVIDAAVADSMCCYGCMTMKEEVLDAWRRRKLGPIVVKPPKNYYRSLYRFGVQNGRT